MIRVLIAFLISLTVWAAAPAQSPAPPRVPVKEGTQTAKAEPTPAAAAALTGVSGRTYTNAELGFTVSFPDSWLIPGDDYEAYMRSRGYDISLRAPETVDKVSRLQLERALERVKTLVIAYRSMPGTLDNAVVRVTAEDMTALPAVRDAVDYFDLMRSQFAAMRLPPDFKYSETQAEQLGRRQFGFLDTESAAGKKRMYATMRGRTAIMFTLAYSKPEDLKAFREILAGADFSIK